MNDYGESQPKTVNYSGSSAVGTMPTGTRAESDVSRISREMGAIQKLLAEHAETANIVEQRLHAVLRSAPPERATNAGQADPRQAASPLTSDLEAFVGHLQQLLTHYNDILSRLEV